MSAGRRQSGFTLLEVLVAFVVAALLIAVILSGFSTGVSGLIRADRLARAALIAQSRLVELEVSPEQEYGSYDGQVDSTPVAYRWRVDIEPFDWELAAGLQEHGASLARVNITVYWPSARGEHSYLLSSLLTLPEEEP